MPDTRKHRGPHPTDAVLFDRSAQPALCEAVAHLCWLLSRGYASVSAVKLVGDRFRLTQRQRKAVVRSACSDAALELRKSREASPRDVDGAALLIDGFNLLTTIEAALAGGVILVGRDGCHRDLASMHGNYRKVEETRPALGLIGRTLEPLGAKVCRWYFDRPVSNSGRLSVIVRDTAAAAGWNWPTELVDDPDPLLAATEHIIVTADSGILDRGPRWLNLAARVIRDLIPSAKIVRLDGDPATGELPG